MKEKKSLSSSSHSYTSHSCTISPKAKYKASRSVIFDKDCKDGLHERPISPISIVKLPESINSANKMKKSPFTVDRKKSRKSKVILKKMKKMPMAPHNTSAMIVNAHDTPSRSLDFAPTDMLYDCLDITCDDSFDYYGSFLSSVTLNECLSDDAQSRITIVKF